MPYLILILFMALVFGICFGVDRLIKKLVPTDDRKAVRLPRRSVIFGILLTFLGFVMLLNFWSQLEWYFRIGSGIVLLMGIFLLVQYSAFSIRYDEEGFTCRSLGKKPMYCRYEEILGQKSIVARSGVNSTLYTVHGEVPIYSAQAGVDDFLKTAFSVWCKKSGTDPDAVENNPAYLTYFPEPKTKEEPQ